jgi:hypothetical protein
LGWTYLNEYGIKYLPGDILTDKITQSPSDFTNNLINEHAKLLSDYQYLENNTIYLINLDDFQTSQKDNKNYIIKTYYPTYNPLVVDEDAEINKKEYQSIYQEIQKSKNIFLENSQKYSSNNIFIDNSDDFSDIVMYVNRNNNLDINLENIFESLEPNNDYVFIKYRNSIKNNHYRIYKDILFPFKIGVSDKSDVKKTGSNDFTSHQRYYVPYTEGKYNSILNKKHFENWKTTLYLPKEKNYKIDIVAQTGLEELHIRLNLHKIVPKLYVSFILHTNGCFEIKLLDIQKIYIKQNHLESIFQKVNDLILKIMNI